MKKSEEKVALDDLISPIPNCSSGSRPALRSPTAGKPSTVGSWAGFMQGIQL
jgi:hypothetical protein